mmetsp:Transcript_3240/g.10853  ORF Transcript_3240/g.10853 Transcript_3240/m.10853 type:complete len:96 (-) Transcript_3240:8-295(-)
MLPSHADACPSVLTPSYVSSTVYSSTADPMPKDENILFVGHHATKLDRSTASSRAWRRVLRLPRRRPSARTGDLFVSLTFRTLARTRVRARVYET